MKHITNHPALAWPLPCDINRSPQNHFYFSVCSIGRILAMVMPAVRGHVGVVCGEGAWVADLHLPRCNLTELALSCEVLLNSSSSLTTCWLSCCRLLAWYTRWPFFSKIFFVFPLVAVVVLPCSPLSRRRALFDLTPLAKRCIRLLACSRSVLSVLSTTYWRAFLTLCLPFIAFLKRGSFHPGHGDR